MASASAGWQRLQAQGNDTTLKLWIPPGQRNQNPQGIQTGFMRQLQPDGKSWQRAVLTNGETVGYHHGKEIKTLTGIQTGLWRQLQPLWQDAGTASRDNTVKLWDTSTGKLIKTLTGAYKLG
jgi:WD40 repeat protein